MRTFIFSALMLVTLSASGQEPAQPAAETPPPVQSLDQAPKANDEVTLELSKPESTAPTASAPESATADAPPTEAPLSTDDAIAQEARLKDLLSLVKDNTLGISKRENPAYFALLKKSIDRTVEQLNTDVAANPRFHDLYTRPDDFRGQMIRVNLNARRIIPIEVKVRNVANLTEVFEIWGWTEEAKAHMYCCVVPELPEGFPREGEVSKRIDLVGYFLKMQAYQPGNAGPDQKNLVAPLIMGRITDLGPIVKRANDPMGNWPVVLIIGFGTIVMLRLMMHLRGMTRMSPTHRNYRRRSLAPIDPDALSDGLGETDRGIKIRNAGE